MDIQCCKYSCLPSGFSSKSQSFTIVLHDVRVRMHNILNAYVSITGIDFLITPQNSGPTNASLQLHMSTPVEQVGFWVVGD